MYRSTLPNPYTSSVRRSGAKNPYNSNASRRGYNSKKAGTNPYAANQQGKPQATAAASAYAGGAAVLLSARGDFSDVGSESSPVKRPMLLPAVDLSRKPSSAPHAPSSSPPRHNPLRATAAHSVHSGGVIDQWHGNTHSNYSPRFPARREHNAGGGGGLAAARQLRNLPNPLRPTGGGRGGALSDSPPRRLENNFFQGGKSSSTFATRGRGGGGAVASTKGNYAGRYNTYNNVRSGYGSTASPQRSGFGGAAARGQGGVFASYSPSRQQQYPDHPLYHELKALRDLKAAILVKLAAEKQGIEGVSKQLKAIATQEASLNGERKRLEGKREALAAQKAKITAMGTPAEAKVALSDKMAALAILKDDYQCTMIAMKQLETTAGSGNNNGDRKYLANRLGPRSTSSTVNGGVRKDRSASLTYTGGGIGLRRSASSASNGARGKLQNSLDQKRLTDEELMCAKYDGMIKKIAKEMEDMRAYLAKLVSGAVGGDDDDSRKGEVALMSSEFRDLANSSPSKMALMSDKARERRRDYEQLRTQFDQKEKTLDLKLHNDEIKARAAYEEASDKLASVQYLSQDHQTRVQQLRAAITNKMATIAQKRTESEHNAKRAIDLEKQVNSLTAKVTAIETAIREGGQALEAAKLVHAAALSKNVKSQQEADEKMKREIADIVSKINAETLKAQNAQKQRDSIVAKTQSNTERWAQQDAARRKLIETLEKVTARRAEVSLALDQVKEGHEKELQGAEFATQKGSIIADLRLQFDRESIKLADIEKQNAQLEKVLNATVDLLKRNNVEVMF